MTVSGHSGTFTKIKESSNSRQNHHQKDRNHYSRHVCDGCLRNWTDHHFFQSRIYCKETTNTHTHHWQLPENGRIVHRILPQVSRIEFYHRFISFLVWAASLSVCQISNKWKLQSSKVGVAPFLAFPEFIQKIIKTAFVFFGVENFSAAETWTSGRFLDSKSADSR